MTTARAVTDVNATGRDRAVAAAREVLAQHPPRHRSATS